MKVKENFKLDNRQPSEEVIMEEQPIIEHQEAKSESSKNQKVHGRHVN